MATKKKPSNKKKPSEKTNIEPITVGEVVAEIKKEVKKPKKQTYNRARHCYMD